MAEEEKKKKRKKAEAGDVKEHKPNWRETHATVEERAAYAHFAEHRKHIASFCGTANHCRGYIVVRRTDEERRMRARSLAYETTGKDTQITDDTDVY